MIAQFTSISEALGWLSAMDRNGLWNEYCEDFNSAVSEHGEVDLDSLNEVAAEMQE